MPHFILCSGRARHGKDVSAEIISEILKDKGYSVLITHYADLLKFICKSYLGWDGKKDEAGRALLQYIGTDCVRTQDPNFWVDFVVSVVKMLPDKYSFIIIPDVRFPNEIERIKEAGFPATHVRIIRPDFDNQLTEEQKTHQSETALDDVIPDFSIENTTISELKKRLEWFCECFLTEEAREETHEE